jgi:3-hydroxyacyl-CoA dehydrogenase
MFYADAMGLGRVAERLEEQARRLDDATLMPAPLLRRLAVEGRGFDEM